VAADAKPWRRATALVTVTTGGVITGLNFVPGTAAAATAPAAVPLHLLALDQTTQPAATAAGNAQVRAAIVNVAKHYLQLAQTKTPAQMEALIWDQVSTDSADHGPSCAAFASLALELAAQATGHQSWAAGGSTYPWPVANWADPRVDANPSSPAITPLVADAQAHDRYHPLGDGYTPRPGDFALYDGHVEVVVSYTHGTLVTIGADSLPDLTVNEHSSSAPLASQGITGFTDNGNLPPAAGTQPAAAAPAHPVPPPGAGASPVPAGGVQADSTATAANAPGQGATQGAKVPGLPGAAAFTSAGGIPGAGGAPAHAEHEGRTASVPGLLTVSGSPGTTLSKGAAVIPGANPSPPAHAVTPAAPKTAAPHAKAAQAAPKASTPAPSASPAPKTTVPAQAQGGAPKAADGAATQSQQAFINGVAPGAVAAQQKYGVPASVTIAQAINESGWGKSSLAARYHNLFGIKGSGPAGSVTLPTQEYQGGQWVTIDAQFAAYHNDAESIAGHAQLLATSGYYGKAMADRADPGAFANDLTGVYATDPTYGATLIGLMSRYNLYQYGTATAAPTAKPAHPAATPAPRGSGSAAVPGVITPHLSAAQAPAPATAGTSIPGLVTPAPAPAGRAGVVTTAYVTPARSVPAPSTVRNVAAGPAAPAPAGAALAAGTGAAGLAFAGRRRSARYAEPLPQATATALFASAKGPLSRGEYLYRDIAASTGVGWELLAAVDWMGCEADPRRSPVHGEKLGTSNGDGTCYRTKSEALGRSARDLLSLAAAVYGIDLAAPLLSVRELAAVFAAFRWGALLKRHQVSAMEFPYSVAGLTSAHQRMHWPAIDAPGAPDRPGSRFREPFGAVPVVLSLGYPAIAG
jgi:flagellum-specific peptidoglycan hydrolase FlgJ